MKCDTSIPARSLASSYFLMRHPLPKYIDTACTCKALQSTLVGPSCPDAGYLWRCNFRRRWLFGLRRRHRPLQQQASSSSSNDVRPVDD